MQQSSSPSPLQQLSCLLARCAGHLCARANDDVLASLRVQRPQSFVITETVLKLHRGHVQVWALYLQMWPAFRHSFVFDTWRRYFRMRIITPLQPFMDYSRRYLCVQFPHAAFPMACWLNPAIVGLPGSGRVTFSITVSGHRSFSLVFFMHGKGIARAWHIELQSH